MSQIVRLTTAELAVLRRLASGATYRTIATELFLSPATIAFHAAKLQRRLKVSNNVALVAVAICTGVLSAGAWPPELTGMAEIDLSLLP